ncbi:MAG TPA: hypothetical protein VN181_15635 [Thermoanaerobaculia bacterium]|nr:hypothetical protein [Thermoanaerobaculia bacterium]
MERLPPKHVRKATVVAVLDRRPVSDAALAAASGVADWLELRVDRAGEIDAAWLRERFAGALLYTHAPGANRETILRAARDFDFITLDEHDLVPAILDVIEPSRRVIRCRTNVEAKLHRLELDDELTALQLLAAERRDDLTAYGIGRTATWSRILAPHLGAPFVFGRIDESIDDEGAPPLSRLVDDYDFPHIHPVGELFAMAGNPVAHSLSPRIHNAGYRATGRAALYLPFHVGNFAHFWRRVVESDALDVLGLPLRAISVVSPFKTEALRVVEARRVPIVDRAESTNLLLRDTRGWLAETTDADGVLVTLRNNGVVCNKRRVAVVGCGGSGRAMAAALEQAGADVTIVNRSFERGMLAEHLLHLPYVPLSLFSPEDYSVVVNATPVGRGGEDELPFAVDKLSRDTTIVDLVYRDGETALMRRTRGPGRVTIDGREMLLTQAARQFELMTGDELPDGIAERAAGLDEPLAVEV